jgi:hypothetical protein
MGVAVPEMGAFHRLMRRLFVPWLDPEKEQAVRQHSDEIHERSIAARIEAEGVRRAYQQAGQRLRR